jgi:LuxR family maltose regulon positive regulatory protein
VRDRRYEDAAHELDQADTLLAAGARGAEAATKAVIESVLASLTDDADKSSAAMVVADRVLAGVGALSARPELGILLETVKARAALSQGPVTGAADLCTRVVADGVRANFEWAHVECLGYLSLIAAWRGENRKAMRLARQVLGLHDRALTPLPGALPVAHSALAWVCVETNDFKRARRHIAQASGEPSCVVAPVAVTMALVESRIRRAQGDLSGARAVLAECRRRSPLSVWWAGRLAADDALIDGIEAQRAGGEAAPVGDASAAVLPRTLPARIHRLLNDAHGHLARGNETKAVDSLEYALRLAAPERLRRPFGEAPADIRRLLRTRRNIAQRHGWLDASAERTEAPPRTGDVPTEAMPELLTEKEREVLRHLSKLLTTEEIAGAMTVSTNTVRTHVRNILRKLGVSRRNQAIRRARELRILD